MKNLLKTALVVLAALVVTACSSASERDGMGAQGGGRMEQGQMGGGMQHPEFEKISEEDFYAGLNLSSEVKSKVEVILADFEQEFKAKMEGSNRPPQKEEMEVFIKARDEKIEPLLTSAQYKTYKKTVEGLFVPEGGPERGQGPMKQ